MSKDIYSNIWAEILIDEELGGKRVYIYDHTPRGNSSLVLPNLLAIKKLRDYLDNIVNKNKKYYKNIGGYKNEKGK